MADPARRSQQRPPRGEHLAHSASSRFHQDGRPHAEGDEDSGDGEMARRRRRQRKRPQEVLSEGEEQERGPAGATPLSAQLSRLCVAPPGAARLYDKLEQLEQALPTPSELYEQASVSYTSAVQQATALSNDAAGYLSRALSSAQLSVASVSPKAPHSQRAPLPPLQRAALPPGSLRLAREGAAGPYVPPWPRGATAVTSPRGSAALRAVKELSGRSSTRRQPFERSEGEHSSAAEEASDEESSAADDAERRRPPASALPRVAPRPAPAPLHRPAARSSDSDSDDGAGGVAPLRAASTLRYARSLSSRAAAHLRASARGALRSPFVAAAKHSDGNTPARSLSFVLDVFCAVLASLLSLFVPQLCPPTQRLQLPGPLPFYVAASAQSHLCSLAEQLDWRRFSALHAAVFVLNWATLLAFCLAEAVFLWRELAVMELCDEDRTAAWGALSSQLAAFPRLAQRMDRLNGCALLAATWLAALLACNWGASCALALREQYAEYRTPVLLLALVTPAARRLCGFWVVARDSRDLRLALPLWGHGLVSLNCVDERFARTGEEDADAKV